MNKTIGIGTYGTVIGIDDTTAVKKMPLTDSRSFIREVVAIRALSHPNIIKFTDVEIVDDQYYIYMHRYQSDLRHLLLGQKKDLHYQHIVNITLQLIHAVSYLHQHRMIHGDICTSNILVDIDSDDTPKVVLCDFGISVPVDEPKHDSYVQVEIYRAPEVYQTDDAIKYTNGIDMWSLGCVIYELINRFPMIMVQNKYYESSWHIATFLKSLFSLHVADSHQERMKTLLDQPTMCMQSVIMSRLGHNDMDKLCRSKIIDIMCKCLIIDPIIRLSSEAAMMLMGMPLSKPAQFPVESLADYDDMIILTLLPQKTVKIMTKQLLTLANNIFRRMIESNSECEIIDAVACIYIAFCVYTHAGSKSMIEIIEKSGVTFDDMLLHTHDIIFKLNFVVG